MNSQRKSDLIHPVFLAVLGFVSGFCTLPAAASDPSATPTTEPIVVRAEDLSFQLRVLTETVEVPAGMAFLPDGDALIADRANATLLRLHVNSGETTTIAGRPYAFRSPGGGLLDVLPHPDFATNHQLYLAYTTQIDQFATLVVDRYRLQDDRLHDRRRIFTMNPPLSDFDHFGGRLAIRGDYLYITTGDRHTRPLVQYLGSHVGKILRLHLDGRVPADNPFVGQDGALPEIWSYGHRNPQGLVFRPGSDQLWSHEHGPLYGDELNLIQRGANYGWPLVSHGEEYAGGPIGDGRREMPGITAPVRHYTPTIAPSGMTFYSGKIFEPWAGNLLLGAMATTHLQRLVLDGDDIVHEERLLTDLGRRVRIVREGPDGLIYLGVDGGAIWRLEPVPEE